MTSVVVITFYSTTNKKYFTLKIINRKIFLKLKKNLHVKHFTKKTIYGKIFYIENIYHL